ncbi:MAG TPA: hypothetical protein VGC65_00745 [Bacteroidia bacterium]|jgi:hypothetical protein
MNLYKKTNSDSGVYAYEIKPEAIVVQFNDGKTYLYTYQSAGRKYIEEMKRLAETGKGLTTFINKNVKKKYEKKLD